LLAGTFARGKEIEGKTRAMPMMEIPASELAGGKAAASCTHSKASLRSHRWIPAPERRVAAIYALEPFDAKEALVWSPDLS
jgi:hypothetical protein